MPVPTTLPTLLPTTLNPTRFPTWTPTLRDGVVRRGGRDHGCFGNGFCTASGCACFEGFTGELCVDDTPMQVRAVELANVDVVWGLRGLRERGSKLRRFVTGVEDSGGESGLSLLVGRAEYDGSFDLADPDAQLWILNACANLTRDARLRVREGGVICPLADLDTWLAGLGNRYGGVRIPIAGADAPRDDRRVPLRDGRGVRRFCRRRLWTQRTL